MVSVWILKSISLLSLLYNIDYSNLVWGEVLHILIIHNDVIQLHDCHGHGMVARLHLGIIDQSEYIKDTLTNQNIVLQVTRLLTNQDTVLQCY